MNHWNSKYKFTVITSKIVLQTKALKPKHGMKPRDVLLFSSLCSMEVVTILHSDYASC